MATKTDNNHLEARVLVLMPTGRDAALVCSTLEKADIEAEPCADSEELIGKIGAGAGVVLLGEEVLTKETLEHISKTFDSQPVWSDLPVLLFAGNAKNSERLLELVGARLNATIIERPIRIAMLISAVRGALRAREKQYQTRDLLNQLAESDHQKDLFLATLSHELRTPLNSMLGWIKLLRNKSDSEIDFYHGLDVIERNAKTQSKVISDILFVSRVITGKLELEVEIVDIKTVVQTAIDIMTPSVEAKKITLQTSFGSNLKPTTGDADRLQQVFLNLLSNAVKFTPSYGQINVRVTGDDSNIEIAVADSGKGIKPEFLPYVFERFRQADSSYTREVGGLGLGLAIVQHLVELHGGTVDVKSDGENSGAAFFVTLPVTVKADAHDSFDYDSSEHTETSERELEGVHVLLVEDDEDSREMLKVVFNQYDMKTTAVESAIEALEAIKKAKPDILVSDVGLPGEDGYTLIRKIRRLAPEQSGDVPAIALTGYASSQDRARALEAGYQEHLAKPVDIEILVELVKNLVNHKSSVNQK